MNKLRHGNPDIEKCSRQQWVGYGEVPKSTRFGLISLSPGKALTMTVEAVEAIRSQKIPSVQLAKPQRYKPYQPFRHDRYVQCGGYSCHGFAEPGS